MKAGFLLSAEKRQERRKDRQKQKVEPSVLPTAAAPDHGPALQHRNEFNAGKGTDCTIIAIPDPVPDGDPIQQCQWIVYGSTKETVLNTPGYPSLVPLPRSPDLYEVRSTPDMGYGVFAKCDIKSGSLIFAERPLIVAPIAITVTPNNTTQQKNQAALLEYERVLEEAVSRLPPEAQTDFRALHNSFMDDGSGPLLGIMKTNNYAIMELYDGSDMNEIYISVCKIASRINHSCVPNTFRHFTLHNFSLQFLATRDIEAGEQLFSCYSSPHASFAARQAELSLYGFVCKCSACANTTPESDILRRTYTVQIFTLKQKIINGEVTKTMLEDALQLEEALIKEGLDLHLEVITLLEVILVLHMVCGDMEEAVKYSLRVKERKNFELS